MTKTKSQKARAAVARQLASQARRDTKVMRELRKDQMEAQMERNIVRGRGKFSVKKYLKRAGKWALTEGGKLGGRALGSMAGAPTAGAAIGGAVGSKLSKVFGFGKYDVVKNTLVKSNPIPTFIGASDGEDGIIVCHKEFLTNVSGSTTFNNRIYPLNPGLSTVFPWLSNVSSCFTEYEMLGCLFEYRPTSGNIAGASPALGCVVMATNYNVNEPEFTSKTQMASAQYSVSVVPCDSATHPIECKPDSNIANRYLIRHTDVPDKTLYDLGTVQVATEGMQSTYVCGELWVTYHIRLTRPVTGSVLMAVDRIDKPLTVAATPFNKNTAAFRGGSNAGGTLVDDMMVQKPDGTYQGVFDGYVFPPLTGDYLILAHAEFSAGYPAAGGGWSLIKIPNCSVALSDLTWIGTISSCQDLTSAGDLLDTAIWYTHLDASRYNQNNALDMSQRIMQFTPPYGAAIAGNAIVTIIRLPDGIGSAPYLATALSLENRVKTLVQDALAKLQPAQDVVVVGQVQESKLRKRV